MKTIEDIPKKDFLQAPDGYFDSLPNKINTRIHANKPTKKEVFYKYSLGYALPSFLLLVLAYALFVYDPIDKPEAILAQITTEELSSYLLENDDLSFDEFIAEIGPSLEDATLIEEAIYNQQWSDQNLEEYLNDSEILNF